MPSDEVADSVPAGFGFLRRLGFRLGGSLLGRFFLLADFGFGGFAGDVLGQGHGFGGCGGGFLGREGFGAAAVIRGRGFAQRAVGAGVHFHTHGRDLIGGDVEGAALFHGHGVVVVDAPPDEDDQQDGEDAHALREALGAQVLHGQAAEQGADGGADAVQ